MDEGLAIPIPRRLPIINRIRSFYHWKASMFDAARDVWFPLIPRSPASAAEECPECTAARNKLQPLCHQNELGTVYEPKKPNESIQLEFWGLSNT